MKFVVKLCLFSLSTLISVPAFAESEPIAFHLGCTPDSKDCIELPYPSGFVGTIRVKREPEMTVGPADVEEAEARKGELGREQIHLRLKGEPAEKFAKLTGNNRHSELVIVAGGTALSAPVIQEAITAGSFSISVGRGGDTQYLDKLPWLKKMSEEKQAREQRLGMISITSYIALGLILLGGSLYFAFFRRGARS